MWTFLWQIISNRECFCSSTTSSHTLPEHPIISVTLHHCMKWNVLNCLKNRKGVIFLILLKCCFIINSNRLLFLWVLHNLYNENDFSLPLLSLRWNGLYFFFNWLLLRNVSSESNQHPFQKDYRSSCHRNKYVTVKLQKYFVNKIIRGYVDRPFKLHSSFVFVFFSNLMYYLLLQKNKTP